WRPPRRRDTLAATIVRARTNSTRAPMTTGSDIAISLRAAYLALHHRSEARVVPHGATADQFVILANLAQRGAAPTQHDPPPTLPAACLAPYAVRSHARKCPARPLAEPRTGPPERPPARRPRTYSRPHGERNAGVPAALYRGRSGTGADARRAASRRCGSAR